MEVKSTLHYYTSNIRSLRRERREREASKYRVLQAILRCVFVFILLASSYMYLWNSYFVCVFHFSRLWSGVKRVREDQGYSSTPLWISFKR